MEFDATWLLITSVQLFGPQYMRDRAVHSRITYDWGLLEPIFVVRICVFGAHECHLIIGGVSVFDPISVK